MPPLSPLLRFVLIPLCLCALPRAGAVAATLQCSPVNGLSTPREAVVWARADEQALLQLAYRPADGSDVERLGEAVLSMPEDRHCVKLLADGLQPDTAYDYRILLNGQPCPTPAPLRFRTAPVPGPLNQPDFSVALLAGNDPASGQEVFDAVSAQAPVLALWLGDAFGSGPEHWDSLPGRLSAATRARQSAALAPLLGSVQHLALMGGNDFGPSGADSRMWNAEVAHHAFELAWANPQTGLEPETAAGRIRVFHWADIDFFLLDSLGARKTGGAEAQLFGSAQIDQLLAALRLSRASFKCIVSSAPIINPEAPDGAVLAPAERRALLEGISAVPQGGIVILSGSADRPGELSRYTQAQGGAIYELTVGSCTRPAQSESKLNYLREPGSYVTQPHFALIGFSGYGPDRALRFSVMDARGQVVWAKRIRQDDLAPRGNEPPPIQTEALNNNGR